MDLLGERIKTNLTAFGKPFGVNSLVMVSDTPQPISGSSAQLGFADKWTLFGIVASIMVVSLLLSISKFYNKNPKKTFVSKKYFGVFFKCVWDSTVIIFYEPFENVSKRVGPRIVCGVWILACVIIIGEISAAMKSKYSFVEYHFPKSLDEIIPGSSWQLMCGKEEFEILRIMSGSEHKLRYILETIESLEHVNILSLNRRSILFYLKHKIYHYYRLALELISLNEILPAYISDAITELYFVYPLSFEISKDKTFVKLLDFLILSGMETKWSDRFDSLTDFHVETSKWHPPPPETNSINLKDLFPIFKIFAYGQLISTCTLLFEFFLSCFNEN